MSSLLPEDFYIDPQTGLFVLTAAYLLKRGYCCHNNCRHCPYKTATATGDSEIQPNNPDKKLGEDS